MLCELDAHFGGSFVATWSLLTVLGLGAQLFFSGLTFFEYYVKPTYEKWRWKTNAEFPSAESVRDEIKLMLKGLVAASLMPAASIYMSRTGRNQGFCGLSEQFGVGYHVALFFGIWISVDLFEYAYHYGGHRFGAMWSVHKHHHHFPNPSPFAVIADEPPDQIVRASPLLVIPMLVPTNLDLIFAEFVLMFYLYGTYLHWGYESPRLSAHNPWINTAYHHYMHHALSIKNKPFYTGFFFKIWDRIFGTAYEGACRCVRCEQAAGRRTRAQYAKVVKPDYCALLRPAFWISGAGGAAKAAKN